MGSRVQDAVVLAQKLEQHVKLEGSDDFIRARHSSPVPPHETSFSPNTSSTLLDSSTCDDDSEAVMKQCFSDAFDREVEYLQSLNIEVTKQRKRQILADILVWAEVTQQHYDASTRSFVLEPNQHDESFLRVGRFLKAAKQEHGLA